MVKNRFSFEFSGVDGDEVTFVVRDVTSRAYLIEKFEAFLDNCVDVGGSFETIGDTDETK